MKLWLLTLTMLFTPVAMTAPALPFAQVEEVPVVSSMANAQLLTDVFYYHYLTENYTAAFNQLELLRQSLGPEQQTTVAMLNTMLLLALGLDAKAQEVFEQIQGAGTKVSGKAWLYLARRWQQQAAWEHVQLSAQQALKDQAALSDDQYQEALYLLVSSAAEQDQIRSAQQTLARMEKTSFWALLAQHNVLAGQVRNYAPVYEVQKTVAEALLYVDSSPQAQAVADRIYLLAGIYLLQEGRSADAQKYFARINQDGPYSAEGLLQYGWAKLEQSKYLEALQPWRVLQTQYVDWHPAVIESILVVPHTMELMGAATQALRSYELVEEKLKTMQANIAEQLQGEYQRQWLAHWLSQQQGQWNQPSTALTFNQVELQQNFMGLTAQTDFRSLLAAYHETELTQNYLRQEQQKLTLWAAAVAERKKRLDSVDGQRRLASLQQAHHNLLDAITQLEERRQQQGQTLFSYASAEQQTKLERLDNVVAQIKYLQSRASVTRNLTPYKERWRRVRGTLLWNMTREQSARQWQTTSEFWQLERAIADLRIQLDHSEKSLVWSTSSWQGLTPRISELQSRLQHTQNELTALKAQQAEHIYAAMTAHLHKLEKRFVHYQTQTRLALARLYDDALQQRLVEAQVSSEVQP